MTSNLIYHIKLIQEKDIMSSISDSDDFSHPIFYELATEIDLEDSKFIWVSDDDDIFVNLNETKVKNIAMIFEKYYELENFDITDDILNSNFENPHFNKSVLKDDFFLDFRRNYTLIDHILDKIAKFGINTLDEIDQLILFQ